MVEYRGRRPCRVTLPLELIEDELESLALNGRIPKIRPVQLRISGLVDASTCCRGRRIKDNGVLLPIAL
jgi:hypothetical protein